MMQRVAPLCGVLVLCGGCAATLSPEQQRALRERALMGLRYGTCYAALPSVRAQAVEALQRVAPQEGLPWIRACLTDEHPAVRFAACTALGMLRDRVSLPLIEQHLADVDPSVQVAAILALHRMGEVRHTPRLAEFLLEHPDPTVRRNTAMILGRLQEKGAVELLARAMLSEDEALRIGALESMALLGGEQARRQLRFSAYSGDGAQQTFALLALAETRDPTLDELFRIKLETARHLETRLAAAKGLGLLGSDEGYAAAVGALDFNQPVSEDRNEPPEVQIMRVRQLAAHALGAIGKPDCLPQLDKRMNQDEDPRVQLAAAMAIVQLTADLAEPATPFRRATTARK